MFVPKFTIRLNNNSLNTKNRIIAEHKERKYTNILQCKTLSNINI